MDSIVNLVYAGRYNNGGSIAHMYFELREDGNYKDAPKLLYKKKICPHSIGAWIQSTRTETGVKGPHTFVKHIPDKEQIRRWANRDIVSYDDVMLEKLSSKNIVGKVSHEIDSLRKAYRECSYAQKQLFINRLIVEIVK